MIGIIRYLKGYVKIRVWGYSPERFMNLCTNRGIFLWGLSGDGSYYTMYMSLSDYFTIRDIVKKTKTRAAVLERHGLPFFLRDVRKRKAFLAGIALCFLFLLAMSRRSWSISLEGNQFVTDDELTLFLQEQGVEYGAAKRGLDLQGLEEALREAFPLVTWTSATLEGTKLTVRIRENELPSQEEYAMDEKRYAAGADLTAAKDGVVAQILTRSGIPKVKAGDEVKKGDVLISGLIPVNNDDGTVREWDGVVADGDVVLTCLRPVSLAQPLSYQYKNYTGREKRYRFFTIGNRRYSFPLADCGFLRYDEVTEEKRACLFGQIDLPFWTGTILCREYLPVDAMYDEETAAQLLLARLEKNIGGLEEKGVQIIQKDVKIIRKADTLTLQGELTSLEAAVVLRPVDLPGGEESSEEQTGSERNGI